MEAIFELIFQFIGELLLQIAFEVLAELGAQGFEAIANRRRSPVVALVVIAFWGAVAGALSLLILPRSLIHEPTLRAANVVVTPLLSGIAMMLIGRRRNRRGQNVVRLDRFGFAFAFALAMALVRYAGVR